MEAIDAYHKSNDVTCDTNESMLKRYIKMLTWKKNEEVLDIGMGDGKFTIEGLFPRLPKDLKSLYGCEYVPWKVEYAKETYPIPNVNFIELDIQTRNLPRSLRTKFDHIFSFYALNWVYDMRQAVENIFVMLKPGGEILISIVEKGVDHSFFNLSKNPKWAAYGHEKYISKYLTVQDRLPIWRNLFLDTGFIHVNGFKEKISYLQKNRETCEEFYKSLNPVAGSIPKEDLVHYYKDYIAELNKTGQCLIEVCPETKQEICSTNIDSIIIYAKKPQAK